MSAISAPPSVFSCFINLCEPTFSRFAKLELVCKSWLETIKREKIWVKLTEKRIRLGDRQAENPFIRLFCETLLRENKKRPLTLICYHNAPLPPKDRFFSEKDPRISVIFKKEGDNPPITRSFALSTLKKTYPERENTLFLIDGEEATYVIYDDNTTITPIFIKFEVDLEPPYGLPLPNWEEMHHLFEFYLKNPIQDFTFDSVFIGMMNYTYFDGPATVPLRFKLDSVTLDDGRVLDRESFTYPPIIDFSKAQSASYASSSGNWDLLVDRPDTN